MIIAGVTGGIGSGKTAVCKLLEQQGADVFYADEVARRIMQTDDRLRREIIQTFGNNSYHEDGTLNREFLSDRIFRSDNDRLQMNALVHPAVGRVFREFVDQSRARGARLVVKEAALLFEAGSDDLDVIIVVDAPKRERIVRVMKRDGLAKNEVEARMTAQMDSAEMRRRADHIVDNSGDHHELTIQTEKLLVKLYRNSA